MSICNAKSSCGWSLDNICSIRRQISTNSHKNCVQ